MRVSECQLPLLCYIQQNQYTIVQLFRCGFRRVDDFHWLLIGINIDINIKATFFQVLLTIFFCILVFFCSICTNDHEEFLLLVYISCWPFSIRLCLRRLFVEVIEILFSLIRRHFCCVSDNFLSFFSCFRLSYTPFFIFLFLV